MTYTLHIDGKTIGTGQLGVAQDGSATFWSDDKRCIADMQRTRLDFVAANGMQLSGFEPTRKRDRRGDRLFVHREWWLTFVTTEAPA
jgi:hypothetical protein